MVTFEKAVMFLLRFVGWFVSMSAGSRKNVEISWMNNAREQETLDNFSGY